MLARRRQADVSILAKTMPLVAEVTNRRTRSCTDLIVMGAYGHSALS
jgi:nucleotide-binding universal stress UspA family protein